MRLFSTVFLPLLAAAAILYGGTYIVSGARAVMAHHYAVGGLLVLFGIAGIALGVSLWRAQKLFRGGGRPPAA